MRRPFIKPVRSLISTSVLLALATVAQAASNGLVISQVYGGGGSTATSPTPAFKQDWVELFNGGNAAVSLSGLSLQYGSNAGNFGSSIVPLPNVALQPGQYFLVLMNLSPVNSTGADVPLTPDATGAMNMSGSNGKVALVSGTTSLACGATATPCSTATLLSLIDRVSYGTGNSAETTAAAALSTTTSLVRALNGCTDTDNNSTDFSISNAPTPRNTSTALNLCSGAPAPGPSPSPSPTPSPSPAATPIASIQGSGHTSPLAGQTVTTTGVVTKLNSNGFFMQSRVPDNNPDTSDGIFVFTSTAPAVLVGQEVQLTGLVAEFNTGAAGNAQTLAHTVTQLTTVTGLSVLSSGNAIQPTVITFPEATEDDLEKVEGMLVKIDTELTASQNYFLGRYGQITLSAGGRLIKPTNIHPAGSVAALQLADDNARRRILLDDGTSSQNPNPTPYFNADNTQRAGDTLPSLTGVIDYGLATATNTGLADYKIHPTQAIEFTPVNVRTASPEDVGGNVKVASFNVLNYFNGNGTGAGFPTSRGATTLAEFSRQRDKIIKAIKAIDADVVGLMEIENDGESAQSAIADLVNGLNTAYGTSTYSVVPAPPQAGSTGTDEIKVAMIRKHGKVNLVGLSRTDTHPIHNRPPMAQTFSTANGEKFTVVVNHFKSKGSCPASGDANAAGNTDAGDGQGCWNSLRVQQAVRLHTFLQTIQSTQADSDVLVIGDLNAYGKEDPILALTSSGYADLAEAFSGTHAYSYVFDGEQGYLDHALASTSLRPQVVSAKHWHINADEPSVIDYNVEFKQPSCALCGPDYYTATPYRSSDHDPVVIGLSLIKAINGTARGDALTGTAGDDRIHGGEGADVITTGAGHDVLVYSSLRDGLDAITDFSPGSDRIDLTALAATLRTIAGNVDVLAGGYITLVDTTAGVQVRIDTDGSTGAAAARPLLTLRGVSSSQIEAARDLML
jgi:uncharacterized protein